MRDTGSMLAPRRMPVLKSLSNTQFYARYAGMLYKAVQILISVPDGRHVLRGCADADIYACGSAKD
jgi:hypothetical protein